MVHMGVGINISENTEFFLITCTISPFSLFVH